MKKLLFISTIIALLCNVASMLLYYKYYYLKNTINSAEHRINAYNSPHAITFEVNYIYIENIEDKKSHKIISDELGNLLKLFSNSLDSSIDLQDFEGSKKVFTGYIELRNLEHHLIDIYRTKDPKFLVKFTILNHSDYNNPMCYGDANRIISFFKETQIMEKESE